MINIIKMDIYRLFKTKIFYIILFALIVIVFFLTYLFQGLGTAANPVEDTTTLMAALQQSMLGFTVLITIFSVVYSTADYTSGYIKNIGGQISIRSFLLLSKMIALLLYTIIMFVVCFLLQIIANKLFYDHITFGKSGDMLTYAAVQILLHFALALVCMMLALVIRKNAISMTLAVVLGLRMTETLLYGSINLLFEDTFDNFNIAKYTLIGNITSLPTISVCQTAGTPIIIGICFAVISMFISCLVFEKRDIV